MPQVPEFAQVDYLVIGPQDLLPAAEPLLAHRAKNLRVHAAELEDIYDRYLDNTGSPEAAIHSYVRDVHAAGNRWHQLKYVLLLGDDAPGEPHSVPIGYDAVGDFHSDTVYCNLDNDLHPDLACGRLPVRSPEELAQLSARIITYERARHVGPPRLNFYAAEGGFGPFEDMMLAAVFYANATRLIPTHFQIDIHSDDRQSVFYDERRFPDMMTAGNPFLVTFLGHGMYNHLQAKEFIDDEDIAEITSSGDRPPIVNLLSCAAGCFAKADCFAEDLLKHEHGPVAVIGSAVSEEGESDGNTSPIVLNVFSHALAEYLDKPRGHRLGDVFLAAQQRANASTDIVRQVLTMLTPPIQKALALHRDVETDTRLQAMQMTLLGDPALVWRPGKPLNRWQRVLQRWVGPYVRDARNFMPRLGRPTQERVQGADGQEVTTCGEFDLAHISALDAEMLLHVVDYMMYSALRATDREIRESFETERDFKGFLKREVLRGYERSLPRPGSAQYVDGQLQIDFADIPIMLPVSTLWNQNPDMMKGIFPRGKWGTISIGESGRLALTASIREIGKVQIDIASGLLWESQDGQQQAEIRQIHIDLNRIDPCITTTYDPPRAEPVTSCPPPPSPEQIATARALGRGLRNSWDLAMAYFRRN